MADWIRQISPDQNYMDDTLLKGLENDLQEVLHQKIVIVKITSLTLLTIPGYGTVHARN